MKGRCLLIAALSIGVAVADEPCRPIDGIGPLVKPGNVLLLGEIHGTVESPAFALDVACHAAGKGLPVVVGLELWPGEQERMDAYLESAGTDEDRKALLDGPMWQSSYQDGRNSRAMLELIDGLRELRAKKLPVRLALFDASGKAGGQQRERDMARNLAAAVAVSPRAMTIVLTGNRHSRVTLGDPRNASYEPMGYLLGRATSFDGLVALNVAHGSGSAWVCAPDCGITRLGGEHGGAEWSVEIDEATRPAGHRGWYHVGAITASPPATMDPSDPAAQLPEASRAAKAKQDPPVEEKSTKGAPLPEKYQGQWQAWDFGSRHKLWAIRIEGRDFHAAAGEDDWYSGHLAIRPDEDPAEIDFAIEDCHCSYKGMTSKAIYRWDGQSIVVSAPTPGSPRPQRFVEGSGQMMRLLHEDGD
jgi:uncharacterized protein (TIGR03067 family)